MNKFKSILLGLVLSLSFAQAQEWSLSGNYTLRDSNTSVVVATRFDTLWTGTGKQKGLFLDLNSLVGGNEQFATYGGSATLRWQALDRVSFTLGPSITKSGGTLQDLFKDFKFDFGVNFGVWYVSPVRF